MKRSSFFSLRALEIFSCVAEHRSFTKAAAQLGISQSAVSHQIKKLELDLNTPLLIRNNKKVELSDAGIILYKSAAVNFANIYKTISQITSTEQQSITIRVTPTFGRYWLSPLLPTLWKKFPNIEIIVYYATPNAQSDITVDIDIIWNTQKSEVQPTNILMYDEQVPICKKGYLTKCNITSCADLNKAVLLYEGHRQYWEKYACKIGIDISESKGHNLDDFSSIMFFVNKTEGMALSKIGFLKDILSSDTYDIVSPHTIMNDGFYNIHLNSYTENSPIVQRIKNFIVSVAQENNKNIKQLLSEYSAIKR